MDYSVPEVEIYFYFESRHRAITSNVRETYNKKVLPNVLSLKTAKIKQ